MMLDPDRCETHFSIQIPNTNYNSPPNKIYKSFIDVIFATYELICTNKIPMDHIRIINHYKSIPTSIFEIIYDNGLILVNTENHIKISSIIPEAMILDTVIDKMITITSILDTPVRNDPYVSHLSNPNMIKNRQVYISRSKPTSKPTSKSPAKPPANRSNNFLQKSLIAKNAIEQNRTPTKDDDDTKLKQFDEQYEADREKKELIASKL